MMGFSSARSGLIGTKLPKFSVFGDTMNTASRMESTCVPGRVWGDKCGGSVKCGISSMENTCVPGRGVLL